jgi:hypothetical protein
VKTRIAPALCMTLVVSALAFAGCAAAPSQDSSSPAPDTTAPAATATTTPPALSESCNADAAQQFMGKKVSDEVVEQARIAAGAKTARALRPDMMVTMEYNGDRLNLATDDKDTVVRINCG